MASGNVFSYDKKVTFLCNDTVCELQNSINSYINSEYVEENEDSTLFVLKDEGVEVNSIVQNNVSRAKQPTSDVRVLDAALSCEHDRDYDCEAWDDYHRTKRPYILALRYHIENYEWRHTLTQGDIDRIDAGYKLIYTFTVGALTAQPAGWAVKNLMRLGVSLGTAVSNSISTGLVSSGLAFIFTGESKSKLKAGDQLVIKGGNVIAIVRNGRSYTPQQIAGGSSGGGSGDGSDGAGHREGREVVIPPIEYCYRTFSNGQVIQVPCE
ncbi:hypothetical protein [Pseudoalteromonas byunsanensis]|uniref:Uncharacterized protein n=1 Tax=Pseudoalteromonas byunsanensis TaxID=327939 RepID=A0A1S1N9W1_9GAMM|nr:hypothetical protein [Pseudoalteromonas byunsanensis]OHU96214.1 hypothetical protein BIW53_06620 [Pseudoalteromonas byunsanensis]